MHCQMCLSSESESPSLLDMRGQFFMFKDQRMDLLSCFNYCKQIKIENEQNAKICESCQPKLIAEYISKQVKCETSIADEQSIIPIAEIKEEPELNIASEWILKNYTEKICDLANEIVVPKKEIKTEAVLYQIIFPAHEIKEEPELQIDDENVESDQEIRTGADVTTTTDNTEISLKTVPENHQKINLSECKESKNYQCSQCRAIFEKNIDFDKHLKETHLENNKLKCLYCVKTFKFKNYLTMHMDSHSDWKRYPCKHCSEAFTTRGKLALHLKNTHFKKEYRCHHCSEIKKSKVGIQHHLVADHFKTKHECPQPYQALHHVANKDNRCSQFKAALKSEKRFQCVYCVKSYISKYVLADHMECHSDWKKYPCRDCPEAFNTKLKFFFHMKSTHSLETFQCHYCSAIKNSRRKITRHVMCHIEATHKCSHCEKKFKTLRILVRHQLTHVDTKAYHCNQSQCAAAFKMHKSLKNHMETVHSGEKLKCMYCVKTFNSKQTLTQHMDSHSDLKKYPCKDCSEAFNTKSKLFAHFQSIHSIPKFQCHYCSAIKNSRQKIKRHLMWHIESTHKCSHCEKKFTTTGKLVRHQLTHVDTKTYHCNQSQCTASFKTQTSLKKHMKTVVHPGEKFKCLYCVKTFNLKLKLTLHMDTHSDLKKYPCKDCSEAFNTKSKLFVHFQNIHSIPKFQCHYCSAIKNSIHKIKMHLMCHREATHKCSHCEKKFKTSSNLAVHQLTHVKTIKNCSQCTPAAESQIY